MAGPLLETKLYVPASRSGLVTRPRLSQRLQRGLGCKLVLVSAPAGFGKTTLLAEWLARTRRVGPRAGDRVAVPRPGRQRPRAVLDLRDRRAADAAPTLGASALDLLQAPEATAGGSGAHHAHQRPRRDRRRRGAGARRLPRHRVPRHPRRDGLPARPPAAPAAPGDRQPRRPAAAAGPAPGAGRAGRGARRRPALHRRRGGVVPQRRDGPGAHPRGRRRARGAHRRVDRCAPARGAVDAGTRRPLRVHRGLRRRRPVRRRLPGRGGGAAPVRPGPGLPAAHLGARRG